jgi:hypothetical protein
MYYIKKKKDKNKLEMIKYRIHGGQLKNLRLENHKDIKFKNRHRHRCINLIGYIVGKRGEIYLIKLAGT